MEFNTIKENRKSRRTSEVYLRRGGTKHERGKIMCKANTLRGAITKIIKSMKQNRQVQDRLLSGALDKYLEKKK